MKEQVNQLRCDWRKIKNHQPRLRVVAWNSDVASDSCQAQLPAGVLSGLIRTAGIEAAMARRKCMTLMEVDQRNAGRVKIWDGGRCIGNGR